MNDKACYGRNDCDVAPKKYEIPEKTEGHELVFRMTDARTSIFANFRDNWVYDRWEYDANGNLESLHSRWVEKWTYEYAPNGEVIIKERNNVAARGELHVDCIRVYDRQGRLIRHETRNTSLTELQSFEYEYLNPFTGKPMLSKRKSFQSDGSLRSVLELKYSTVGERMLRVEIPAKKEFERKTLVGTYDEYGNLISVSCDNEYWTREFRYVPMLIPKSRLSVVKEEERIKLGERSWDSDLIPCRFDQARFHVE